MVREEFATKIVVPKNKKIKVSNVLVFIKMSILCVLVKNYPELGMQLILKHKGE